MQYLDELKVLKIYANDGKEYELKADFRALKTLNNLMSNFKVDELYISNAFDCIDKFLNQVKSRIVLLPYFIKAMLINEDLTIEYIENHILGMNFKRIGQAINVIFELLSIEFKTDNEVEIKKKGSIKRVTFEEFYNYYYFISIKLNLSHDKFMEFSPHILDKLFNLNTNYEKNIILETIILLNGNNKEEDIYLDDLSIFL